MLNEEEINMIWSPELLYLNSKGYTNIKAGQHEDGSDSYQWVHRRGSWQSNDLSELDEDYLYPRSENQIIMEK